MHDSLPTGDLTELLGAPSPACDAAAAEREKCKPYDPDHAVQPLSSALDHDAPYHLVVVGGQEVPVGYGGWSGPNWTETIHRWLSGTAASPLANGGSQAATDERPSVSENDRTSKDIASPASPNTAHRAYLESQSSETLVLSEDVVDIHERSQFPAMEPRQLGRGEGQQYKVHAPEATTSMNQFLSPDNTLPTRSPALLSSTKMGRSGSSSTTDTDRSACTDAKSDLSGKAAAHETTNADQVPIKHSPHFRRKMRKLLTSSLRKSVLWAYTVPFGYIALVRIWCKQVAQVLSPQVFLQGNSVTKVLLVYP